MSETIVFTALVGALLALAQIRERTRRFIWLPGPPCGPRALSALTGSSIREAEDAIRAVRGSPRGAVRWVTEAEFLGGLRRLRAGATRVPVPPATTLRQFAAAHPVGKFAVFVPRHVLPVIDGRLLPQDHRYAASEVMSSWRVS